LTLPPERGRSPPAARRSVAVFWSIPETLHWPYCCGPGRSAVQWWRYHAPAPDGGRHAFLTSLAISDMAVVAMNNLNHLKEVRDAKPHD
jgi:hypothetical protein